MLQQRDLLRKLYKVLCCLWSIKRSSEFLILGNLYFLRGTVSKEFPRKDVIEFILRPNTLSSQLEIDDANTSFI